MTNNHYDVIIIGTGAGGGTLAYKLAASGKKILILERGNFLPRNKRNWDSHEVMRYRNSENWYDKNGKSIEPNTHYYVGGNTKFYGGALFRLREQDFEKVIHQDGISPEWPLKYQDFAPYYDQAEKLYEVHGKRGLDPTEPATHADYPFPAISHEPYIQHICDALKDRGLHPFYLPLAIKLNEVNRHLSACIRCDTCDGFPCLMNAKADADINGIRPAMAYTNIKLLTNAKVVHLHTSPSGREVTGVEAEIAGTRQIFSGDIVIVACGAINSAALLLKSANDKHPNGLANSSQLVGRNYMAHKFAVIMSLSTELNPTVFPKTLAVTDFYWGEADFAYPMGSVQMLGNINKDKIAAYGPPLMPNIVAQTIANHSVGWLLITEDLPDVNNRVRVNGEQLFLEYTNNNESAFNRLIKRWTEVLKSIDSRHQKSQISIHIPQNMTVKEVGHQCGTCRFGEDAQTSVLDINCRTHDVDNLYVVDGSFFPSSTALNPTLTIVANALRVGDHLLERMG
ncbi:choline dehydrogenase-like flavoprotein [Nostoc sp. PCC 7524]|uniref:GMC oxidoreductase n=1 Tax=Nostoc sp. (strain ATCC 29411 / PCC 7524) TaxID=28072 RepID=UPI00029ECCA4|nr:GMC family oxidoreductase [Nostoc sp. PCC 7524]AFY51225.1 choline dehydrogenase-like flavoprotein [Nostoc sp. PCC 7524]